MSIISKVVSGVVLLGLSVGCGSTNQSDEAPSAEVQAVPAVLVVKAAMVGACLGSYGIAKHSICEGIKKRDQEKILLGTIAGANGAAIGLPKLLTGIGIAPACVPIMIAQEGVLTAKRVFLMKQDVRNYCGF